MSVALRRPGEEWRDKVKLSEQVIKVSNPGIQNVRRFSKDGRSVCDALYDERYPIDETVTIIDPDNPNHRCVAPTAAEGGHGEDLLIPVYRKGVLVGPPDDLEQARNRAVQQLAALDGSTRRLEKPHQYPAGLERGLYDRKLALVKEARGWDD